MSDRLNWFATASGLALSLVLALDAPAQAADAAAAPVVNDGWTVSVEGGYLFNDSDPAFTPSSGADKLGNLDDVAAGDHGGMFGLSVGRAISPDWDWQASFHAVALDTDSDTFGDPTDSEYARSDVDYQYADLEFGRTVSVPDAGTLRLFAGPRVLHVKSDLDYGFYDQSAPPFGDEKMGDYSAESDYWAFGPRIGLEADVPLIDSAFSLRTKLAGSVLFTSGDESFSFDQALGGPPVPSSGTEERDFEQDAIWNAAASASVAYRISDSARVEVGYQAEIWKDMVPAHLDADEGPDDYRRAHADVVTHGPSAKLSWTFD